MRRYIIEYDNGYKWTDNEKSFSDIYFDSYEEANDYLEECGYDYQFEEEIGKKVYINWMLDMKDYQPYAEIISFNNSSRREKHENKH